MARSRASLKAAATAKATAHRTASATARATASRTASAIRNNADYVMTIKREGASAEREIEMTKSRDGETRAFGAWPAQPLLRLSVLPGKGTHHRGHLTIWLTDDARRIPLHAEMEFRYGTFSMDLAHAEKIGSPRQTLGSG